jgi:hypothetical protein
MKKIIALFSSLLILAGVKAQTAPAVKKETVKPSVVKPTVTNPVVTDTATTVHKITQLKQANPTIKKTYKEIKATKAATMKETPAAKPFKY